MPQNPNLIATKTPSKEVLIFDKVCGLAARFSPGFPILLLLLRPP